MIKMKLTLEEVIARWRAGESCALIASDSDVTRAWISHLVKRHATPEDYEQRRVIMAPKSSYAKEFAGAILDEGVKEALRNYTTEKGISMSGFIAEAIEEKLDDLGVEIIRKPVYKGEPLPLEAES
jgi:hypothetical protein